MSGIINAPTAKAQSARIARKRSSHLQDALPSPKTPPLFEVYTTSGQYHSEFDNVIPLRGGSVTNRTIPRELLMPAIKPIIASVARCFVRSV